ncbi:hypothetical protein GCM10027406_00120 [Leifsonia lichenia]
MTSTVPTTPLVVSRLIAAAPEPLFDAWLNPDALAVWMRPGNATHTDVTADPTVGGEFRIVMHNLDAPIVHRGTYLTIDRATRLAFTWRSPVTEDEETLVTVDFEPRASGTEVIVTHERLPHQAAVDAHSDGWTDCLTGLAVYTTTTATKGHY